MITVIIATYNSEFTLEKTISSLIAQTLNNFEVIIIDGKSEDNTIDIIKKYTGSFSDKKITYRWISEPDTGIYDAWNKGLKLAKGQWVTFLGSDDVYASDEVLMKSLEFLEFNSNCDWVYSKVRLVDSKGNLVRKFKEKWDWTKFSKHMYVPHAGSFHNREFFKDHGGFDTQFKIAGDYEMLLRKKSQLKTRFLDLFTVNMLNEGVSNKNIKTAFKEETLAKKKHKIGNKMAYWFGENLAYLKYLVRKITK